MNDQALAKRDQALSTLTNFEYFELFGGLISMLNRPKWFRRYPALLALGILGLLLLWGVSRIDRIPEPSYQGRPLHVWMRGHPREYTPAIQAMGTNAIPYLLAELTVKDASWKQRIERSLGSVLDARPPWDTERDRHYHAFLALQVLGSNAVPFMIEAALQPLEKPADAEKRWEIASALAGMGSPLEARRAFGEALRSTNIVRRLAACRTYSAGVRADLESARDLIRLTSVDDANQRAAATRALIMWQTNEIEVLPALIARLDDEQAAVRRLAIDALAGRKTNAMTPLPALLCAYTNEWVKPRRTDDVDYLYRGQATTINEVRWAIRWAIGQIDRRAQPVWSSQGPTNGPTHY